MVLWLSFMLALLCGSLDFFISLLLFPPVLLFLPLSLPSPLDKSRKDITFGPFKDTKVHPLQVSIDAIHVERMSLCECTAALLTVIQSERERKQVEDLLCLSFPVSPQIDKQLQDYCSIVDLSLLLLI